jgi:hypothetical protein
VWKPTWSKLRKWHRETIRKTIEDAEEQKDCVESGGKGQA